MDVVGSLEEMPVGKILGPLLGAIDAGLLCCKSTAQVEKYCHFPVCVLMAGLCVGFHGKVLWYDFIVGFYDNI